MQLVGIGMDTDNMLSLDEAFDTLYRTLGDYWKRDVYEHVKTVIVHKPSLRRFHQTKAHHLNTAKYLSVVVVYDLDEFDPATVAVEVMIAYLAVLVDVDSKVRDFINEVSLGFFGEADKDDSEVILRGIALWLTGDPEVRQRMSQVSVTMCENIDRMLRGSYVLQVAYGLTVC